jgi:hypothetical protein
VLGPAIDRDKLRYSLGKGKEGLIKRRLVREHWLFHPSAIPSPMRVRFALLDQAITEGMKLLGSHHLHTRFGRKYTRCQSG